MRSNFLLLAGSCLLALCSARPTSPTSSSSTTLPPSTDPWYTAPEGFASKNPGDVLRIRPGPGNITTTIANSSQAWNILYRTTDSRQSPTFAVTTVFVPTKPNGTALLSYQIAYDSASVDASPSYSLNSGTDTGIEAALGRGWHVNVPDYEGPLASFTAGFMSGYATLDSVRAALSCREIIGLSLNARYAMYGYSGGALGAGWAAELQSQYAPELNFSGAALGGLTPSIPSVLESVDGKIGAALIPHSILGLMSQYPDMQEEFNKQIKTEGPRNATGFLAAKKLAFKQSVFVYIFQNIFDYFKDGKAVLQIPSVAKILAENEMGNHGVPQMPLLVYKAIKDDISKIQDTDDLVDKYCKAGAKILYERNTVGNHLQEDSLGFPKALAWLSTVFDGTYSKTYSSQGCTIRDVTVTPP